MKLQKSSLNSKIRPNEKLLLLDRQMENTKLKYEDFIEDTDCHFEEAKIKNFDIINKPCCGEKN